MSTKNVSCPNSQGTAMKSAHKLMIKARVVSNSFMLDLFERTFAREGQKSARMLFRERIEGPKFHATRCSTLRDRLLEYTSVLLNGYNNPAKLRKAGKELMAMTLLVAEAANAGSRQTTVSDTLHPPNLHQTSTPQNITSASVQL